MTKTKGGLSVSICQKAVSPRDQVDTLYAQETPLSPEVRLFYHFSALNIY